MCGAVREPVARWVLQASAMRSSTPPARRRHPARRARLAAGATGALSFAGITIGIASASEHTSRAAARPNAVTAPTVSTSPTTAAVPATSPSTVQAAAPATAVTTAPTTVPATTAPTTATPQVTAAPATTPATVSTSHGS